MSSHRLKLLVSGRPQRSDDQVLIPRTPHSRSGHAEEAFTEVELDELTAEERMDDLSYRQQQTQPLLAQSSNSNFTASGYRSKGDDNRKDDTSWPYRMVLAAFKNLPLALGLALAFILLAAVLASLKHPGIIESYIGTPFHAPVTPPTPSYVDTIPPEALRIAYDNYTKFPLTGDEYLHECDKMMGSGFMHHSGGYWGIPQMGFMDVKHHDEVTDYHLPEAQPSRVCGKSITYQLDGRVGLLADLALMAQAAAHAREQNRTFFVDDTYWNRGKWSDHFQSVRLLQPGPEKDCRPPPPEELVACPRTARHWVVNARTAKYHFGHGFSEQYEDPYSREVNRQKPTFERGLQSFVETIRPNAHNARLIRAARTEIASQLSLSTHSIPKEDFEIADAETILTRHHPDPYIAVHIRRGDRHAVTFPHRDSYVPIENFVSATKAAWARLFDIESSPASPEEGHYPAPPITYVASDSPAILKEFVDNLPAPIAVFSLVTSTDPDLRSLVSRHEYVQSEFNKETEEERIRLTRGMIVDFALLSGFWAWEGEIVPGATVCTMSSSICKVAAMGLGWDRAFGFGDGAEHWMGDINDERKRWIDLDNRGTVSPFWRGFDLF